MAHYEIDSTNTVRIWFNEASDPGILQPTHPDGTDWASKKAAEDWAQAMIAEFEQAIIDEQLREQALQSAVEKLQAIGLTAEEIAVLRRV